MADFGKASGAPGWVAGLSGKAKSEERDSRNFVRAPPTSREGKGLQADSLGSEQ